MSQQEFLNRWAEVDQVQNATKYQDYLTQVSGLEAIRIYKQLTFAMLRVEPGQHILDVGCGNGDEVRALAALVGQSGLVVGIDNSTTMIEGAKSRDENAGLPVKFLVGDAHNLDFGDETFDRCRAERVIQHVQDGERVLVEMMRVTRRQGWLVVADPDWDTLVVDAPGSRTLTRKILTYICDNAPTNGWIGRQMYRLFKQAGLREVTTASITAILTDFRIANPVLHLQESVEEMVTIGELAGDEAMNWLTHLQQADEQGHFFSSLTGFVVGGQKP